jgi:protein ImuB
LARFGPEGVVPAGGDAAAVRALPVAALGASGEVTTALRRAGLKTLGDLADRRAEALAARFGAGLVTRLRAVLGQEDHRITPLRRPAECAAVRQFAEPLVDAGSLEVVVGDLLREVATVLEQRGQGGRRFELGFFRADGGVRQVVLAAGRPSRDVAALLRLWRERVAALADPLDPGFGFDAIRLEVPLCEAMPRGQGMLEGRDDDEGSVAELVDRLSARFGPERVLRFTRRDTHDPRREVRAVPAASPGAVASWSAPLPGAPPDRPVLVFEPPQPVEVLSEVPDGPPRRLRWHGALHEIARAEGPERIAPEWWRDPETPVRDYYRVEDVAGHRFWVFRAGLHGEEVMPRWFVQGVFA